jgi:hypothetical protein
MNLINPIPELSGKKFLPIIRASDGEFYLLLGDQPLEPYWPIHKRINKIIGVINLGKPDIVLIVGGVAKL